MNLGIDGKVAWVLGASSGLGFAAASALADEGARVAISARTPDTLEEAAGKIGALAVPVDVTDAASISTGADRIAAELGTIDILVSNAGGPRPGYLEALDESDLEDAFNLTLTSAWRLTKAVVDGMKAKGSGCIIFVTSWSTREVIDGLLLSNTVRSAVVGFSKTLSKELGPHGIRVLCAAPGRIDTDRLRALDSAVAARKSLEVDEVARQSQGSIPLGRYGDPKEFGDVVAFLASERASYVNGITVLVDGGMLNGVSS